MSQQQERKLWGIVLAAGEGTRVRDFLAQLCGGRGIKQFCAVIGRRSLLEHTLARVQRLIPRERILVVVSTDHRAEVSAQLAHWPTDNVIFQPRNRDTAPGILLPLAYLSHRDPLANVALFPSDHCIMREERFMSIVGRAVAEVQRFPQEMVLLGMGPDRAEEGYGWIEPAAAEAGRETRAVCRFWEKPASVDRQRLLARGALWNTFVCVAWAPTLWAMVQRVAPDLYLAFTAIRQALGRSHAPLVIERIYESLCAVNFSSDVCEPLASCLRVLPVPDVGWSDWGSVERICASLKQMGKLDDCVARLPHQQGDMALALPLPKQCSTGMRLG
ncbi:MAG TPA: sugar phosphate nucleotidyltransferase [Candidatus Binatia bacterium]|jgi:mannose-1-phosphate guanylyltransferase|nr:sugar phosphate nucleotidyltransferase [Candidatus Binatia bacterium]